MFDLTIPGFGRLSLEHLILDYNGTLALDGRLIDGAAARLRELSGLMELHVITADTFGKVREQLEELPVTLTVLPPGDQAQAKLGYAWRLGLGRTAAVGNGRNDRLMVAQAALGIAIVGPEGAAVETLREARVACPDILAALDLFLEPKRLVATLRG
jgi:soluble P-type ATPase